MKRFLRGARHNRQIYAFAILGLLLILFPAQITNYASELIGGLMILYGAFDLFMHHFYRTHHIHIGTSLLYLILGFVIFFQTQQALVTIGIVWGIISLREAAYEIDDIMNGHKTNFLQAAMLIASVLFAIMLLFDPFTHFELHVRLVGFEMIFDTFDFMRFERTQCQDYRKKSSLQSLADRAAAKTNPSSLENAQQTREDTR